MNVQMNKVMTGPSGDKYVKDMVAPVLRSGRTIQHLSLEPGQAIAWRPGVWHATHNAMSAQDFSSHIRSSVIVRFMPAHCASRFTNDYLTVPVHFDPLLAPVAIDSAANTPTTRSLLQGPLVDLAQSFTSDTSAVLLDVGREADDSASRYLATATQSPPLTYPRVTPYRPCASASESDFSYKKLCIRQVIPASATTHSLAAISAHRSTQWQGDTPHTPHAHADSEVLIVLRGSVIFTRQPWLLTPGAIPERHLVHAPGVLVFPATSHTNGVTPHHTNTAASDSAEYLCVRFQGRSPPPEVASLLNVTAPNTCRPERYPDILPPNWNRTRTVMHKFFHKKVSKRGHIEIASENDHRSAVHGTCFNWRATRPYLHPILAMRPTRTRMQCSS